MAKKRNVELTIEKAREWYKKGGELREIALQAFNVQELIHYPTTLEEYRQTLLGKRMYYINANGEICCIEDGYFPMIDKALLLPTKGHAEAFRALMRLVSFRDAWMTYYSQNERDECSQDFICYVSFDNLGRMCIGYSENYNHTLWFPSLKMAREFENCFENLIEIAKPLIG